MGNKNTFLGANTKSGDMDFGPNPVVFNLQQHAASNVFYRRAIWTGEHLQMTLMCLQPQQSIPRERHEHTDQTLIVQDGIVNVSISSDGQHDVVETSATAGQVIIIPARHWHRIDNAGPTPSHLISIYGPPNHPHGTVQLEGE